MKVTRISTSHMLILQNTQQLYLECVWNRKTVAHEWKYGMGNINHKTHHLNWKLSFEPLDQHKACDVCGESVSCLQFNGSVIDGKPHIALYVSRLLLVETIDGQWFWFYLMLLWLHTLMTSDPQCLLGKAWTELWAILTWRNCPETVAMLGFQKEGRRPLGFAILEYLNCLPALS